MIGFLVLFGLMSSRASAVTIFDNTTGMSLECCRGWAVTNGFETADSQSIALRFNSGTAVTITDITAIMGSAFDGGSVDFGIMSSNGLVPSGTFLFHQTVSLGPNLVTLSSLNWSISGGVDYWLTAIANPGTMAGWNYNLNLYGQFAFTQVWDGYPNPNWLRGESYGQPMAIISSNETVTPAPAALPLFATGLGALGLLGWRRKRKAAAVPA